MADFCTDCHDKMFGDKAGKPDIDIDALFNDLQERYSIGGFICEGCGLTAIAKLDGEIQYLYLEDNKESEWTKIKRSMDDE